MIYIVLGLIGAVAGSLYFHGRGDFLLGGVLGLLAAAVINQRNGLLAMQKRLAAMESQITSLLTGRQSTRPASTPAEEAAPQPTQPSPEKPAAEAVSTSTPAAVADTDITSTKPPTPAGAAEILSLELELPDEALANLETPFDPAAASPASQAPGGLSDQIKTFFLGGNLMVRVGVVVLLFGFAFLVKYAAARDLVPLEVRLAAAFLSGIGLLILGWKLRHTRFGYAVTLQGGGIGIMYLTLFASARLFQLVPMSLTFGIMVGLVVFSGILAVLQNAAAMAVLGAAGGFMAPVLLSSGSGSHVTLFSYYALLNAGIFGISWFKAWRWLNLLGFIFTFGIGSSWGLRYYRPDYLASTEPFLILFFAFYLAIAVLFALRQPPRLKGYVDSTLVFGLPLVVFGLQAGLVRNIEYGLAFSAMAMGLIYTGLATALWRHRNRGLDALVEAFLSLGVIFGSLTIPFALSGRWTTVAWSLEGAGLVWVGIRQNRWTSRAFGLLLQIGSGLFFIVSSHGSSGDMAVFNNRFLGGMLVGIAGLLSAFFLERHPARLHRLERHFAMGTLAWGLLWWFGTGLDEIDNTLSRRNELVAMLTYTGFSALGMVLLYRRINWQGMRWPTMALLPVMFLVAAAALDQSGLKHPLQGWWLAGWPVAFVIQLYLLRVIDTAWPPRIANTWHVAGILLGTWLLSWEAGWLLDKLADGGRIWAYIAWGGIPAIALGMLIRLRSQTGWPFGPWGQAYRRWLPALLALGLLAWTLVALTRPGDTRPLPYLPLLNPLDLVQLFVFLIMGGWVLWMRNEPVPPTADLTPEILWGGPIAGIFLWLTAVVARTVHHMADVPYTATALFRSDLLHAAVAILWGLLALGCMIAANRLNRRTIWFTGAGLLAVVVIKLFVVDLSGTGTVSRIVSFLAVGGLMLVIGFFTPLPPVDSKGTDPC